MAKFGKVPTYRLRWPEYAEQWDHMEIKNKAAMAGFVRRALEGKQRYLELEKLTGVPWWMSAIIAERESGQDWSRSLAQGDRWDRRSTHDPKGRGPFPNWHAAAVDAYHIDHLNDVTDWRLEKALYYFERFNGWGYYLYHNHMPSSYVWGNSNIQQRGKYVSDGVWNSNVWDTQVGCAAMLRALMDVDPTIHPQRED